MIRFCGAAVLNKKLKQSFNITCGGNKARENLKYISCQMNRYHGTHLTYQAFPQCLIMMVGNKILKSHNTQETNLIM